VWAKESYEIATKIAYQNGRLREPPKGHRKECREVTDAAVFPPGYTGTAKRIANRRIMLACYRLVELLKWVARN
jgi:hypothetical protein